MPLSRVSFPPKPLLVTDESRKVIGDELSQTVQECVRAGHDIMQSENILLANLLDEMTEDSNTILRKQGRHIEAYLMGLSLKTGAYISYLAYAIDSDYVLPFVQPSPIGARLAFNQASGAPPEGADYQIDLEQDRNLQELIELVEASTHHTIEQTEILRHGAGLVSFLLNDTLVHSN